MNAGSFCKVMGIVNVTPDSFSDGGKYFSPEEAVRRALNVASAGADIVDIGGESTRPGAEPVAWDEEWDRISPVIGKAAPRLAAAGVALSVDTYHPETAERALALGANIVNCVYEEPVPDMIRICAKHGAGIVLPYRLSSGKEPPSAPGVPFVYLDPMVGFGTTREEDLELLRSIRELSGKGMVLVGASRKRIVKRLTGVKARGKDIGGNLAIAVWAALCGASAVRVHDVEETVQAIRTAGALAGSRPIC